MRKDDLNVHVFQNRNGRPFHRKDFKWKKYRDTGLVSEKTEDLFAELNYRVETATISYPATGEFLQYIYSMLEDKNNQKIRSKCFAHEFSFTDIFNNINHWYKAALLKKNYLWLLSIYLNVASNSYYEKGRRTNARSLSTFILFPLHSWMILRVRTMFLLRNFHAKRVAFEIAMMDIFNNCVAGSLNNNYFPLN